MEREIRLLSYVGRWQIVQVNRRQTLTDHLYHVSILAWRMVEDLGLRDRLGVTMEDVFRESLLHDLPETLSGDIPSPVHQKVKKGEGWKAWLTARVTEFFPWYEEKPCTGTKHIVTVCDLLEALLYLTEELQMGNRYVEPHFAYLSDRMGDLLDRPIPLAGPEKTLEARTLLQYDIRQWVLKTLDRATEPAKVLLNPS